MRTLRWLNPAATPARVAATPRRGLLALGVAAVVAVVLVAGSSPGRAANVDLLSAANVQLVGAAASDSAGYSVAGAGDVNSDGRADVLVGAPGVDNNGRSNSGSVYVVFGQTTQTRINLASLGSYGYRIDGTVAGEQAGASVANVGDVNGDKRPDALVGASGAGNNGRAGSGSTYVVFGKATPTSIDLAALGSQGYRIDGAAASDGAGANVAAAGDVNRDGVPDALIGATGADNNARTSSGSTYVVFGKAPTAPATPIDLAALGSQGFRIDGAATGDFAGSSVAGVGDVNGDTRPDVLVGAYGADNNGRTSSGSAYLVFGKSSNAPVDLAALGAQGIRIDGAAAADAAGLSVGAPGDVNGDGRPDLLVGAYGADNNARSSSGSAYVVFGKVLPTNVDLASLGSQGYRIDGAAASHQAGKKVAGAGDVNGDGRQDVLVGAPGAGNNGRVSSGSAYVVYGKLSGGTNVDLAALGTQGDRIDGAAANDGAGAAVAGAGDFNGDGVLDLLVGAPRSAANGAGSGAAYVVFSPPQAPVSASLPAVGGTLVDGSTLTAGPGAWTGTTPMTYAYRWQRCAPGCADVSGGTSSTYPLGAADVAKGIRVLVTATNAGGSTTATSGTTALVAAAPPVATSTPTVSGVAVDGSTLTADHGLWTGTAPVVYGYQWQRCDSSCVDVPGAASVDYALDADDVGYGIRVVVTASNAGGIATASSAQTAGVLAAAPESESAPAISGTAEDGATLTAQPGSWRGTVPISYAYHWQRCDATGGSCEAVAGGADEQTYVLESHDIGGIVRVAVVASNAGGSATAFSAPTATVAAVPPRNTTPPVVAGTAREGETLSVSTGSWTGSAPIAHTYRWQRCNPACANVAGATTASYALTADDADATVRVEVTGTNAVGAASATSAETGPVAPTPIANTAPPRLTGTTRDGETLTASLGAWTGATSYAYRWQRCDARGDSCTLIDGAAGATRVLQPADVGSTVRLLVTASNATRSSELASAATDVVAAIPAAAVGAPTIAGTPRVGQTLVASAGTWTGSTPLAYSYQWQRCRGYAASVLGDVPAAYWRLGDSTAPALADATGAYPGTYSGGVALGAVGALAGDPDTAATFDGVSGSASVPSLPNSVFASTFTLEAWVKVAAPQTDKGIAGKWNYGDGGGALLWLDGTGTYTFAVGKVPDNYLKSNVKPTPGVWEHLVGTWDGRDLRLYRNGTQIGQKFFGTAVGSATSAFEIGNYAAARQFFNGSLDEVAVYGRALTAAEVREHYDAAQAECLDLPGATSASYTATAADAHATLRVVVTASNALLPGGGSATARSDQTALVAP